MGGCGSSTETDSKDFRFFDNVLVYEYAEETEERHCDAAVVRVFVNGHGRGVLIEAELNDGKVSLASRVLRG